MKPICPTCGAPVLLVWRPWLNFATSETVTVYVIQSTGHTVRFT